MTEQLERTKKMKNRHPTIPPNCELFMEHAKVIEQIPACFHNSLSGPISEKNSVFFLVEATRIIDIKNDYIPSNWRIVIASVACCAWLDEAERLYIAALQWCKSHDPEECGEMPTDGADAKHNAELWRIWEKQK